MEDGVTLREAHWAPMSPSKRVLASRIHLSETASSAPGPYSKAPSFGIPDRRACEGAELQWGVEHLGTTWWSEGNPTAPRAWIRDPSHRELAMSMSIRSLVPPAFALFLLFVLTGSVAGQVPSNATIPNTRFEEVRNTIIRAIADGEIPSMSVAVAQGGTVIWEEAFGWANREAMIPATPHTMYSMASISKPISTTGLMVLVERGEVELNEPVNTYIAPAKLTAFEGNAEDATVTHILNHTSGLPVHYSVFYEDEPLRQPPSPNESIRRYGILVHPPGAEYQYANFGFGLASTIISKVSGRSFADFMKTEVFLPLGMTHTSVDVGPGLEEFEAIRYDGQGKPVPFFTSDHPGASQVYASGHDLIRFGLFHLGHTLPEQRQIITRESIDLMKRDSDPNPDNDRYGLGWFLNGDEYGYPIVWHTGSMRGTNTMLKFVPSQDIAVVAMVNTYSDLRQEIPRDIIGVLLPDYGEKWAEAKGEEGGGGREPFRARPRAPGCLGRNSDDLRRDHLRDLHHPGGR